jgi:hypothetical protein
VLAIGPIDRPTGVKDFMATVLRVRLSKHHELDVAGIAPEIGKRADQIIYFIRGQCQAEGFVRLDQGIATTRENGYRGVTGC